jgi:hypothetical protein
MAIITVKNTDPGGKDSLPWAVDQANQNPGTTINFAPGLHGTIELTTPKLASGELEITQSTIIDGPGYKRLTVSGMRHSRVFRIRPGATVTISGLTIKHGLAGSKALGFHSLGGGILNEGTLTLKEVHVSHNRAAGDANEKMSVPGFPTTGAGAGGGVANLGTLIVSDSRFEGNQARAATQSSDSNAGSNTAPGTALGGGLANLGKATTTVMNCWFTDNVARGGDSCDGTYSPTGLDVAGDAFGGAIANFGRFVAEPNATAPALAELAVIGSHFSNNRAIGGNDNRSPVLPGHAVGGAIASHRMQGSAVLNVSNNCTFHHNQAIGGDRNVVTVTTAANDRPNPNMAAGGGVFACGQGEINDSQFSNNQATGGLGVAGTSGVSITMNGGDARGGGIDVAFGRTDVKVNNCTVESNWATGGRPAAGGSSGNAWGGGVAISHGGDSKNPATTWPKLTVTGGSINSNQAVGGVGTEGQGIGGGLYTLAKDTDFDPTDIDINQASPPYDNVFWSGDPTIPHGSGVPSDGGNGLGGGVYIAECATATLTDVSITQNVATGGSIFELWQPIVLFPLWKPDLHIWEDEGTLRQWQAQWDNLIKALGQIRLDPAQDKAAMYLNAARQEFAAAADLVRAGRSANREERAKLVKEIATRVESARASFDQLVQAAGLPSRFAPREGEESARLVTAARQ